MHDIIYAKFQKILEVCKEYSKNLVDDKGNLRHRGVKSSKLTDIELIALNITAEVLSIDSENLLFHLLHNECKEDFPKMISRRSYNDRKKYLQGLMDKIRTRIADKIDEGENYLIIDSKPLLICKPRRNKRVKFRGDSYEQDPDFGFCASQNLYYKGYKLHCTCGITGVLHTFTITKASVHDIAFLKDIKYIMRDCTIIGDKGYISKKVQLDLFNTVNIKLEIPCRSNQTTLYPFNKCAGKIRKRIETVFSQLSDQFVLIRNYAKRANGLFTRILSKITALTISQYFNFINNKPIDKIKYAII